MRIGNNSQGIWQFLSRMNGGKANMNMPFAGAKRSSAGGRNTLEAIANYIGVDVDGLSDFESSSDKDRIEKCIAHLSGRFYGYFDRYGINKPTKYK